MSINTENVLSAVSLAKYMCSSLPLQSKPHLKDPHDAVALLAHACMLAVGFRLLGLGEDHRLEEVSETGNVKPLPEGWNASSDYAFRYAHSQSSLQYLIKVQKLCSYAAINGLGIEDNKVHSVQVLTKEYLWDIAFPFTLPTTDDQDELVTWIQKPFNFPSHITDLATLIKVKIIQKLIPGLQKEGYEESTSAANQTETSGEQRQPTAGQESHPTSRIQNPVRDEHLPPFAQPRQINDPLAEPPRRPYPAGDFPPPGFEDEYEINRPLGRMGLRGERRPLNIGERDLYPPGLGPHDPLRGGGYGPSRGIGGGGMHPTFDDPLFGGDGGGMGGYNGRAPPGARYDPVGPGDVPPNLRGGPRFPGGGGFGSRAPPNPFGRFGGNDFI